MSRRTGQPALKERNADDLLAEFLREGSEAAFGEVVRRYAAMVFAVCLKVTANPHDAEDATQATFLNLAVQLKSGKPVHRLGPWLQQVARRAALDVRRSRKRRETHEQRHGENRAHEEASRLREHGRNGQVALATNGNGRGHGHPGATGGGEVDLEKLNAVLAEELGRLPPKYRLPLMSLYFGQMGRDEIAKELGLSVGTLGVRIHRARQMLAQRLSDRGVAPAGRLLSGNLLATAIATVGNANLAQQTAAAAARYALGHDLAVTTTASVLAAMKTSLAATVLAKLKSAAVALLLLAVSGAVSAAAAGAAVRWDVVGPQLPEALRQAVDWARSPWRLRVPRPAAPSLPSLRAGADAPPPAATPGRGPRVIAWEGLPPEFRPAGASRRDNDTSAHARVPFLPGGVGAPQPVAPAPVRGPAPAVPGFARPPAAPSSPPRPLPAQRRPQAGGAAAAFNGPAPAPPRVLPRSAPALPAEPARLEVTARLPHLRLGPGAGMSREHVVPRGAVVVGPPPPDALLPGAPPPPPGVDVGAGAALRLGGNRHGGNVVQPLPPYATARTFAFQSSHDLPPGAPPRHDSFAVRGDRDQSGVVRGWGGAVGDGGPLLNDGRVIADGRGEDRALIFSGYSSVRNGVDNPPKGRAGWFAENGGRLILPKVPVAPGTHTYTWGESPDDPTIDLVNSVRVTLHDARSPGKLDISLFDKGRGDVPTLPSGHTFIGVWSFDAGTTGASGVDLTVRYDDGLAAKLNLNEASLKLWRHDAAGWHRINDASFARDLENNLLSGHADRLDFFAISAPEPSAAALVVLCSATLLRRRKRS